MRARLIVLAALLCAVPATGSGIEVTQAQIDALTVIDAPPSRDAIDLAFSSNPGPTPGLDAVLRLAIDNAQDFGLQIRAIRALPLYCPATPTGCARLPVHDALATIVGGFRDQLASGPLAPPDLLRLRAAMEALGATQSGLQSDVELLTTSPTTSPALLHHPSRDVQVTAVHALRNLCSPDLCSHNTCLEDANAVRALRTGADTQLDAAINRALADLAPCAQP
jgi:hypothetical protein